MSHAAIAPLIKALRSRLGGANVLSAKSDLAVYDCDAFTIEKNRPEVVVFPRSAQQALSNSPPPGERMMVGELSPAGPFRANT